jgi:glyoxylase-like metal-dependent hydrolase (beta-lactamase superfamily II)
MAEIKILIEGYVSADKDGHSCSTVVLVKDKGLNMVVDPGTLPDPNMLAAALKKENLGIEDINAVFITHAHTDHYRNIGMFPRARTLDYWGWWEGDTCAECDGRVSDDVALLQTPGHSYDGMTLVVKTAEGAVAVCGDVFWKENFPVDDPYASDKEKLKESRQQVLSAANWVIPGHGKKFKVSKV